MDSSSSSNATKQSAAKEKPSAPSRHRVVGNELQSVKQQPSQRQQEPSRGAPKAGRKLRLTQIAGKIPSDICNLQQKRGGQSSKQTEQKERLHYALPIDCGWMFR
uniref:Uncharacterized protein n=1 Tax=Anopheles melas TaxID=34690 RepID=A0A182TPD8_9DIPT